MNRQDFKSNEEWYFYSWLKELEDLGFVFSIEYEPDPFLLTEGKKVFWRKQNVKGKQSNRPATVRRPLQYTTDFKVVFANQADGIFTFNTSGVYTKKPLFYSSTDTLYFEVKPSYNFQNMNRSVKDRIAWTCDLHDVDIELVKPESLFKKSFYPSSYFYTDSGNLRWKKVNGIKQQLKDILPNLETFLSNEQSPHQETEISV
jgi:hypothetical protein